VWAVVSFGGCAAITGIDQITEQQCAPNCGAADGTVDALGDHGGDQFVQGDDSQSAESGDDSTAEASNDGPAETSPPKDSGGDAPKDTGSGIDSPVDSPPDVAVDAPFDSGCGPLNVPAHCSACPDTCASNAAVETSTSCSGQPNGQGATCSYTCATGYLDCNSGNPPNTDGCECHVAGATQPSQCCSGACPVAHNNGLNQGTSAFVDCFTFASSAATVARDACVAFTGNLGQCTQGQCLAVDGAADGDMVWCASGSPTACACWTYQGPNVGYVHDSGLPGNSNCYCADKTLGDTTYN
jgi:hypothetical protein